MLRFEPACQTQVRTLVWEDPLEKEMATHSSIHAWTEEPGGLQSMGPQRAGHDLETKQQQQQQDLTIKFTV